MPAIAHSIDKVYKAGCIASLVLVAACGGGGGDAPAGGGPGGGAAVACPATSTVAFAPAPAPGAPPAGTALALQQVSAALNFPLYVTAPPGDSTRLFVVQRGGLIRVLNRATGAVIGTFLDVSGELAPQSQEDERGLLGLAFDPGYASNGRFYVSYIGIGDIATVARYVVSGDPATSNVAVPTANSIIITTTYQSGTLFGGQVSFGRDGFLYVSRGSSGNNSGPNAQNVGVQLGKMLRINVNGDDFPSDTTRNYSIPADNPCVGQAGAQPEIWSMGLRNPWRFSFDSLTGDLYIGDVGGNDFEEVNVSAVASGAGRGANYGWRLMEGTHCFTEDGATEPQCDRTGLQQPILDYPHSTGPNCNSVLGGYVYRGTTNAALAALRGTYFYGDSCEGVVRSFRLANNAVTEHAQYPFTTDFMTSFGEDGVGELYITTAGGQLLRIVAQ